MRGAAIKGVTIKNAAEILGVAVGTLRKWDKDGFLRAHRAKNGYRLYKISDLEDFAKKQGLTRHSSRHIKLIP
jgi:excisionase family DNA binding protein